jgi:hypothetical protein
MEQITGQAGVQRHYNHYTCSNMAELSEQRQFILYIPARKRDLWAKFRDHVENLGKPACDVIFELIEEYMDEKK